MGDGRAINQDKAGPGNEVIIPSLHLEKPADENDASTYRKDLNLVDLYMQSRDSVVEVNSWTGKKDDALTMKFSGSGFFVSPEGKLATNFHVVKDRDQLEVRTFDGKVYKATVEKVDVPHDLAVLKVEGADRNFKPLPLGESKSLKKLENVVVFGHPHGWDKLFASAGMHERRSLLIDVGGGRNEISAGDDLFRVNLVSTIHIQPGNSGGPMLNERGKVVGTVSMQEGELVAHAIPVEYLQKLLKRDDDSITRAFSRLSPETSFYVHNAANGLNVASNIYRTFRPAPTTLGGLYSIGLGAHDLIKNDFVNFKESIQARSLRGSILSGLDLTADALLIAGGAAMMTKRFALPGFLLSTFGSGLKLGPNIAKRIKS